MTILGKGLVLLNLIMSVVFLGFAVNVYTTAGSVQDKNVKLTQSSQIDKKEKAEAETKFQNQTNDYASFKADATKKQKDLEDTVNNQSQQLQSLKQDIQTEREKNATLSVTAENTTKAANERSAEVAQVRKIINEQIKQNTGLMEKTSNLQDENSKLKNEKDLVNSRNQQLVGYVKLLENAYQKLNNGILPSEKELVQNADGGSPVPDVEGVVTKVESDGKFVTLSIGEDDGLRKGHILQIWREKPISTYLGQVMIVETRGRVSIAKTVNNSGGVLKENDKVGPRIMSGRQGG